MDNKLKQKKTLDLIEYLKDLKLKYKLVYSSPYEVDKVVVWGGDVYYWNSELNKWMK